VPVSVSYSILVVILAVAGAAVGVRVATVPALSRGLVPFSGGLLLGIAAFWMMPEMAHFFGWGWVLLWVLAGFVFLALLDRYVYPVCPSCSHTHDHEQCAARLHGFAAPLLIAAGLHSFFDGWALSAARRDAGLGTVLLLGIAVHKLPAGLALGVIARDSLATRWQALAGCIAAESMTILGAMTESGLGSHMSAPWTNGLLAIAAGTFLYLGYHAIHVEYKRRGAIPAFMPALTGVAGSSVIRLLVGGG
jgi:zinc and cadmium transporter